MSLFPRITHIDDVLPAIQGKSEFIVAERDGYKVINYTFSGDETFEGDPILRECRGIVFDQCGKLISRRLHKFFNVGETAELAIHKLPWDKSYVIMDKLDGSMITPIYVHGKQRWGTKMGLTDVAGPVEEFVAAHPEYEHFAQSMSITGWTPIFEWCSPKQRIVIDHPEDKLILLHIRDNLTGEYMNREQVETNAKNYGIPVVRCWNTADWPYDKLHDFVSVLDGGEGVVVQFENGEMVKMKSEWYVRIHRAKDMISDDRKTLDCILNNQLDDLKPILPPEDVERIHAFEHKFTEAFKNLIYDISCVLEIIAERELSRKDFALGLAKKLKPVVVTTVFKFFDAYPIQDYSKVREFVLEIVKKNMTTNAKFDEFRQQVGF